MDLRKPSGLFFLLIGALVFLTGVFAPGMRAPLTSINDNLYSGISMLVFGGILLWLAYRTRS
jgi:hypothetical protein